MKRKHVRVFYNLTNRKTCRTLKEAKESTESAFVFRARAIGDRMPAMCQVYGCGKTVCTVKEADAKIAQAFADGRVTDESEDLFVW